MTGQRVAVTAACSGIGLAIARAFRADGAVVHVCDVDPDAVETVAAEGLVATRVDVADGEALDEWMDGTLDALGGLDVLVNNAGIAGPTALVEDVDPLEWERCLAVGLTSHYRTCARVAPIMKAARHGCIINISSTSGLVGMGMRTPYAAAKWAVIGLTKSLAVELGPYDVRVNAVCPGSVEGERMKAVIAREAAARGLSPEAVERDWLQVQSIARYVQPEEVAALCLYLASDAATMVSGQAIAVDGNTETFHIA